jgi:hypothetical protein
MSLLLLVFYYISFAGYQRSYELKMVQSFVLDSNPMPILEDAATAFQNLQCYFYSDIAHCVREVYCI